MIAERGIGFRVELVKPVVAVARAISLTVISITTAAGRPPVARQSQRILDRERHAHAAADAEGGEAAARFSL